MTNCLIPLLTSLLQLIAGITPGNQPKAELLFVGDAMCHQAQLDRAKELGTGGNYDFSSCFTLMAPTVMKADYAVVNLETPLGGGAGGYTGFPCFSAPDNFAQQLQDTGFDLFLTANNHTLDRSDKGLRRTLDVLDGMKADHIGTYRTAAERDKLTPFIRNINGFKIGFLNYTYGTNGLTARDGAEVAIIDKERMAREIKKTRVAGAEIIVVCIHWGVEYVLTENSEQRALADFMVKQGVDLVIGSHPHVIQPMKVVDNKEHGKKTLVVYSLGNFISNMKTNDTRGGGMVTCTLTRDRNGRATFSEASYDTFYAAKPSGGRTNFSVIPSWMSHTIPSEQKGWWNTFNNAARRIFAKYNVDVPAASH